MDMQNGFAAISAPAGEHGRKPCRVFPVPDAVARRGERGFLPDVAAAEPDAGYSRCGVERCIAEMPDAMHENHFMPGLGQRAGRGDRHLRRATLGDGVIGEEDDSHAILYARPG